MKNKIDVNNLLKVVRYALQTTARGWDVRAIEIINNEDIERYGILYGSYKTKKEAKRVCTELNAELDAQFEEIFGNEGC